MSLKKQGPPRLVIPEQLIEMLEETYETGESDSIPIDNYDDGLEFITYSKRYAIRENKSFRSNWNEDNTVLTYHLTDKRPYRKSTLPREK